MNYENPKFYKIIKNMLQTGLSHGVAVMPNEPRERFNDHKTGAHFSFEYMCRKIDQLLKERKLKWKQHAEDNNLMLTLVVTD